MNKIDAIKLLRQWDEMGRGVFTVSDLRKLFPEDHPKAFTEGLARLVKAGIIVRAARGVYVNPFAESQKRHLIEHIAIALRRGEFNYLSLESMLSQYGAISQIPMRLTIMTTGREGEYHTPYGTIEFTHTSRSTTDILDSILTVKDYPLRIATKETAWRDLKRVGRNVDMVDMEALNAD